MAKSKYSGEFEINTSPKVVFPYLHTPGGLSQWFAEDVNVRSEQKLQFIIDGEEVPGKIVSLKNLKQVTIEMYRGDDPMGDPDVLDFKLEMSEVAQSAYLVITEYSDGFESETEFYEIWEGILDELREIIGA